jgi:hypothetical protein
MILDRGIKRRIRLLIRKRRDEVWRFDYETVSTIRLALTSARARTEAELAARRSYSAFKARGPLLYIVYLRDYPEPGPFPLTAPYEWPRTDRDSLRVVIEAAFSSAAAQAVYVHYLLSAKTAQGQFLSPAGRVDLLIGRRIATALPEDHPARHRPPSLQIPAPVLFYEDPEED